VRITDRGPSSTIGIIDLSLAAAPRRDSVGPARAGARGKFLAASTPRPVFFPPCRSVLSANAPNRERLRERLSASYSPIFIQHMDSPDGVFIACASAGISGEDAAHQLAGNFTTSKVFTPACYASREGTPAGGNR